MQAAPTFVLGSLLTCGALFYAFWERSVLQDQVRKLSDQLLEEINLKKNSLQLRDEERKGRIAAEKALKNVNLKPTSESGGETHYNFEPIGFIRSCFNDRYGTPRQGNVVATSKAILKIDNLCNPSCSLDRLSDYSHVWVVFVFHLNTNAARELKLGVLSKQANNKNLSKVKSKVRPPRLNGAKVGLFATRTPHRPNPIGLSLAKIERITADEVHLSGIDLVDGTPVLDIKPYVPAYDSIPEARVPEWIYESPVKPFQSVMWNSEVITFMDVEARNYLKVLDTTKDLRSTIEQVLIQDIRSHHQRDMGKPTTDAKENGLYAVKIDNFLVEFSCDDQNKIVTVENMKPLLLSN